jgi:hypothetical protein
LLKIVIILVSINLFGSVFGQEVINKDVEYVSWNTQSGKLGGPSHKIKITKVGYSELSVKLWGKLQDSIRSKLEKKKWEIYESEGGYSLIIKRGILPPPITLGMFNELIKARITDLKPQKMECCDMSVVAVGIQIPSLYREIILIDDDLHKNLEQEKIFKKCKIILRVEELNEYLEKDIKVGT